jgi:transcriptional regulator with XRE-family HTH domain
MAEDTDIGPRIRLRRQKVGLSLRELARRTGLTASFLSLVEREKTSMSIGSLRRIAEALDVPILHFLEDGHDDAAANGLVYSPVVRGDQRRKLVLPDSNVTYELLVPDLGRTMEAFLGRMEEGTDNVARRLRGPVIVGLNGTEYQLRAGDSIYFEGDTLTRLGSGPDEEVIWLSVISPPVF